MKKVLVTGATGFIGNYVVTELLKSGFKVIATSTNPSSLQDKSWKDKVDYIAFNFKDFSPDINYYSFFRQPDIVIHLAWEGLPNYKDLFHFEDNLNRHYCFIKNLISHGLKDVTVTGTCFEYGFVQGCLSEEMRTSPANPYAIAKDSLQKFLSQLQKHHPFTFKWIRLFYMYGKGQSPQSLFSQLDKAIEQGQQTFNMSGGEQVRDYLPVEKVAEYTLAIAMQQEITGVINCCSGKPVKLKEMVQQYLKDKKATINLNLGYYPYVDYEPMEFWGDNRRLKAIINDVKRSKV